MPARTLTWCLKWVNRVREFPASVFNRSQHCDPALAIADALILELTGDGLSIGPLCVNNTKRSLLLCRRPVSFNYDRQPNLGISLVFRVVAYEDPFVVVCVLLPLLNRPTHKT